jgi:hypothetical protein
MYNRRWLRKAVSRNGLMNLIKLLDEICPMWMVFESPAPGGCSISVHQSKPNVPSHPRAARNARVFAGCRSENVLYTLHSQVGPVQVM